MHIQLFLTFVWLLYSVSSQGDNGERTPYATQAAIAEELNAKVSSLRASVLEDDPISPLSASLCSYINGKLVDLSSQGRMYVIGVSHDTSSRPAPDAEMFGRVLSGNTVFIEDLFVSSESSSSALDNIPLTNVTYYCDTMQMILNTQTTHIIIPNVMELQNYMLTLTLGGQSSSSITLSGDWVLSDINLHTFLHYLPQTSRFIISGTPTNTDPSFEGLVEDLTHQSLPIPNLESIFENIKALGDTSGDSTGIMAITSSIGRYGKVFLILDQDPNVNPSLRHAFAVEISNVRLSDVLLEITGQDVSSFPYFGTVVLPGIGYTISTGTITSYLVRNLFTSSDLLHYNSEFIPEGKVMYAAIASEPFRMNYIQNQIRFQSLTGSLNVGRFIDLLPIVDLEGLRLPPGIDSIVRIDVMNFVLDPFQNQITVRADLQQTLSYFANVLSIRNPIVQLDVDVTNSNILFEATGYLSLDTTELSISIANDEQERYILEAWTDSLSLSNIISSFSAQLLPPLLQPILNSLGFLNFAIENLRMSMLLDSSTSQIFLSGQPVIAGLTVNHMSVTIVRIEDTGINKIAIGLELNSPNLADLLGQISPTASAILRSIPFLNQQIDTDVIIAPNTLKGITLSQDTSHNFDLREGINIQTEIPFPNDDACTPNPFCVVARSILPRDTVLHIDSSIVDSTNFNLVARLVSDVDLFNGALTITQAGVEIRVGEDTSIGIIGTIALDNPRLDFTARIYTSVSGVVLQMIFAGCWENAFGIGVMDICDIQGSIGFGQTIITELSFGAEVRLGANTCSNEQLIAIGYVGLSTVEPRNNYYYASFPNGLTLSTLLGAFCISLNGIPPPIANTGLQPGFVSSFTAAVGGKSIPEINLYIPQGLLLNGTVNIYGLEASCTIVASTSGMEVSIALPPLRVASLLRMQRSSSDETHGPYLQAIVRPPEISAEASGHLCVLQICAGATLEITEELMSATIEGSILGIVQASLTLSASHSGSFSSAEFYVRGSFRNSIFEVIERIIRDTADTAANAASAAVNEAGNFLENQRAIFRHASRELQNAQRELSRAQREFDNAIREVNRLQDRVNNVCHTRSCGSVCVFGCGGCSCSWRRGCRCRCSGCYSRIPDVACQAANAACHSLKQPFLIALDGARATVRLAQGTLDVARAAFQAAQHVANAAQHGITAAQNALDAVGHGFRVGLQFFADIASFGLNNLINIRAISFESSLSAAAGGSFSLTVEAAVLGVTRTININADIHDIPGTIARPLGELVVEGFGGLPLIG